MQSHRYGPLIVILILFLYPHLSDAEPLLAVGGLVTDETGQPVDGLVVSLQNPSRNATAEGRTGDEGAGRYAVLLFDYETNDVAQVGDTLNLTLKRSGQVLWTGERLSPP